MMHVEIVHDDVLSFLHKTSLRPKLVYMDPPFFTQKTQKLGVMSYPDKWNSMSEYIEFMQRVMHSIRLTLDISGSLFIHADWHAVHYIKCAADVVFGMNNFRNEIIWSYDFGGRGKRNWPRKHDTILWYSRTDDYTFNYDQIERIPYMAPGLCGEEKAERGKTPTDVWWHTIVPTAGKERTGYPTQKPVGMLKRIVNVHSNVDDIVLDLFAGSGSFAYAAANAGRNATAVDINKDACSLMSRRFA